MERIVLIAALEMGMTDEVAVNTEELVQYAADNSARIEKELRDKNWIREHEHVE